jgi:TRAP-type C4-dicarboxylate transport system permease small subunit
MQAQAGLIWKAAIRPCDLTAGEMTDVVLSRGYEQMDRERKAQRSYKDVEWAIIWGVHVVLVAALGAVYAPSLLADAKQGSIGGNSTEPAMSEEAEAALSEVAPVWMMFVGVSLAIGLGWAIVWIMIIQRFAKPLIKVGLLFPPVLFAILGFSALLGGSALAAVIMFMFAAFLGYYAWWIFSEPWRIEFAELNLQTIAHIIRKCVRRAGEASLRGAGCEAE